MDGKWTVARGDEIVWAEMTKQGAEAVARSWGGDWRVVPSSEYGAKVSRALLSLARAISSDTWG